MVTISAFTRTFMRWKGMAEAVEYFSSRRSNPGKARTPSMTRAMAACGPAMVPLMPSCATSRVPRTWLPHRSSRCRRRAAGSATGAKRYRAATVKGAEGDGEGTAGSVTAFL